MNDKRNQPKTVTFKPDYLSSATQESEGIVESPSPRTKSQTNPGFDFQNSLSSVWALNAEFFNYPPINFNEGESSWAQIIKENILQPFLPKNRLILQHIVKDLKQEQQKKVGGIENEKSLKLGHVKSSILTGNAANVNLSQLEKILYEIQKKMDRKSPEPRKLSKEEIFETRSQRNANSHIKKKERLKRNQLANDLLSHRLFDMNLSLKETEIDQDYFKIYEAEFEDFEKERFRHKKGNDLSNLKNLTISNNPSPKAEIPVISVTANQKEDLISKRMMRRKSCCCSVCGGVSNFEKRTIDLVFYKEEMQDPSALSTSDKRHLQADLANSGLKERFARLNRQSKDNNIIAKIIKEKESALLMNNDEKSALLKTTKALFEGVGSLSERRRSVNLESSHLSHLKSRPKNKASIFTTAITPAHDLPSLTTNIQKTHNRHTSLAIPTQENVLDISLEIQTPVDSARRNISLNSPLNKKKPISQKDVQENQRKLTNNNHLKPMQVAQNPKRIQSNENIKKEILQVKGLEPTQISSIIDKPVIITHLSQPINTNHRLNLGKSPPALTVKIDDSLHDQINSPQTVASFKKLPSVSLGHRRNVTLNLNTLASPKSNVTVAKSSFPKTTRCKRSTDFKVIKSSTHRNNEITKIYNSSIKSIPVMSSQLKLTLSPSALDLPWLRSPGMSVTTSSKASLEPTSYRSPNNIKGRVKIKKSKAASVSVQPSHRSPTCP